MGFKGLNHLLRYVTVMHVRGDKLEGCLPFLLNLQFVGGAAFIVEDLEVDGVAVFLEAGHDAVGRGEAVAVVAGLEGLN